MCTLRRNLKSKKRTGYKIVAEKGGKDYSVAMGFCYQDTPKIPVVTEQHRLSKYFADYILKPFGPFNDNMQGRTAVICKKQDTKKLFDFIRNSKPEYGYTIKLKRAIVRNDLMSGWYDVGDEAIPIVAGREIEILEEVQV